MKASTGVLSFAALNTLGVRTTGQDSGSILPIPELLTGSLVDGVRIFNLSMQHGTSSFLSGLNTDTYGYNGDYLGPSLQLNQGEQVALNVTNEMSEDTTTHWHGIHLPPNMDGTPHQIINPSATWTARFEVKSRASTFWYHPHPHSDGNARSNSGVGGQVYRGLAGLLLVQDSQIAQLDLPNEYGIDDIPLIIQDRSFNADGSFDDFPQQTAMRKGDQFLVNGMISPLLAAPAQLVRFRILNASNARIYNLGFSDTRTFYQIGSDGGLLEGPVALNRLLLAPAERAEILLDLSSDENQTIALRSFNAELGTSVVPNAVSDTYDRADFNLMTIQIGSLTENALNSIPTSLNSILRIAETDAVNFGNPRSFVLANGRQTGPSINGLSMDMSVINEVVQLNDTEIWEVRNDANIAHPFHVHGDSFQILSRNGALPDANELGWKDVVLVKPDETVLIIKNHADFADSTVPFMYHCHLLEHEDGGMMGQYTVVE